MQGLREFAEWIEEIAGRDGCTAAELLSRDEFASVLGNSRLNAPQRIARVREALHRIRFPQFTAALKRWNETVRRINPDPGAVAFTPDLAFEKNRLEVNITVTDPAQALLILRQLAEIPPGQWRILLDPGSSEHPADRDSPVSDND